VVQTNDFGCSCLTSAVLEQRSKIYYDFCLIDFGGAIVSDLIAVSDLIGDIYDAALDPALWPLVLERIVQYFKAAAAVLYVQDIHLREGQFYFSYGDDPYFTRLYLEKYARINPLAPHFLVTNVGDVFRAGALIPYEELKETQFFKEWLQPQQYTEFVATTLDKSATSVAFISVTRDITQGFMDDASVERMRVIAPHLRRAVMIGKIVDLRKVEAGNFESVVNGLLDAVLLVDARRRIVYANESATRMMSDAKIIRRGKGDVLQVNDTEANSKLRDALAGSERAEPELEVRGTAISVRSTDGERYLAHVLPLTSGARRLSGAVRSAAAAVFIRKAALDLPSPLETVAKLYRLTPAELRVLYAVMEAGGVSAISSMLGISEATVKTHIQHLFEKTGTRRQTDLVKLVAGHVAPIRT